MKDTLYIIGIIAGVVIVCSLMGHADAVSHCQSIATVVRIMGACK